MAEALPPLVENLFAVEAFADEASAFSVSSGNVKITLASIRFDNSTQPGHPARVVIGRLVLPVAGAQALAAGLFDFLKQRGLASGISPNNPADVN